MRKPAATVLGMIALALPAALVGCGDDKTPPRGKGRTRVAKTEEKTDEKTDGKTPAVNGTDAKAATQGWGSLKGRFIVTGEAPKPPELNITQNMEYCNPFKQKGELRNESVEVSSKNELRNVVIYLRGKPERVHDSYKDDEKKEVVLDNHKCRFDPHITLLRTTQTLRVKNSDPFGHNTKLDSIVPGQSFNEQIPAESQGVTKQLKQERFPIPYGCNIHPWMKGHLLVLDHPYMAVSGADGSFEIKNLPAGEHEFQFWHEVRGGLEVKNWKRGQAKITIKAGEPTDLENIEVPADLLK